MTSEIKVNEIVVCPPGFYRWWEDNNRIILVYSKS